MNKKYIPVALLAVGIIAVIGVFFSLRGSSTTQEPEPSGIPEEIAPEISFDQRPYVTLTPTVTKNPCPSTDPNGHWLKLNIVGANRIAGATTLDYVLEYMTSDNINQGVPGTVSLSGVTSIDRDLLLGSASSGKCRFDKGVDRGTLTLRFRDKSGKLLGKLSTQFHLQDYTATSFTSIDDKFSYTLSKPVKKGYFVTLNTIGVPEGVKGTLQDGPYGIFASDPTSEFPGKVTLGTTVHRWGESKWNEIKDGVSSDLGVFVSLQ